MATGTGKTFTAIRSIISLQKKVDKLSAIVIVPQIDLQAQWLHSFEEEGVKPLLLGGYANAITDGMVKDEAQKTEYLTAIAAKSKRMTELITMLFEYVRVGSEGFCLQEKRLICMRCLLRQSRVYIRTLKEPEWT